MFGHIAAKGTVISRANSLLYTLLFQIILQFIKMILFVVFPLFLGPRGRDPKIQKSGCVPLRLPCPHFRERS